MSPVIDQAHIEFPLGIRVEWFRSREWALRWEEEVLWLQREAATVISDFDYRARKWQSWNPPKEQEISKAFAKRQAAVWDSLYLSAAKQLHPVLKVFAHISKL